jgi:hypothetical protein
MVEVTSERHIVSVPGRSSVDPCASISDAAAFQWKILKSRPWHVATRGRTRTLVHREVPSPPRGRPDPTSDARRSDAQRLPVAHSAC